MIADANGHPASLVAIQNAGASGARVRSSQDEGEHGRCQTMDGWGPCHCPGPSSEVRLTDRSFPR